jgi:hypothetical protein
LCEQAPYLGHREYRRQPRRTFGALQAVEPRQRLVERLLVQKEQRGERLVLSRGGDIPIAREMIEDAVTSVSPSSRGWRVPWKRMKRLIQCT